MPVARIRLPISKVSPFFTSLVIGLNAPSIILSATKSAIEWTAAEGNTRDRSISSGRSPRFSPSWNARPPTSPKPCITDCVAIPAVAPRVNADTSFLAAASTKFLASISAPFLTRAWASAIIPSLIRFLPTAPATAPGIDATPAPVAAPIAIKPRVWAKLPTPAPIWYGSQSVKIAPAPPFSQAPISSSVGLTMVAASPFSIVSRPDCIIPLPVSSNPSFCATTPVNAFAAPYVDWICGRTLPAPRVKSGASSAAWIGPFFGFSGSFTARKLTIWSSDAPASLAPTISKLNLLAKKSAICVSDAPADLAPSRSNILAIIVNFYDFLKNCDKSISPPLAGLFS